MKKLLYTLALVVIGFTTSYAQKFSKHSGRQQAGPEMRAERLSSAWQQKLNLTADQKSKIKQIEINRIKKSDQWRKKDQKDRRNKMRERSSFMKANKQKIGAVLTADQKVKLAESRIEMKHKMKDRKSDKGKRGGENLKRFKKPHHLKVIN